MFFVGKEKRIEKILVGCGVISMFATPTQRSGCSHAVIVIDSASYRVALWRQGLARYPQNSLWVIFTFSLGK